MEVIEIRFATSCLNQERLCLNNYAALFQVICYRTKFLRGNLSSLKWFLSVPWENRPTLEYPEISKQGLISVFPVYEHWKIFIATAVWASLCWACSCRRIIVPALWWQCWSCDQLWPLKLNRNCAISEQKFEDSALFSLCLKTRMYRWNVHPGSQSEKDRDQSWSWPKKDTSGERNCFCKAVEHWGCLLSSIT